MLTDSEISNLFENAQSRQNEQVVILCTQEIQKRKNAAKLARADNQFERGGQSPNTSRARVIEIEANALLVELAKKLNEIYDLTVETARKLSTRPFRPHRLLAKNGQESKIGGVKKRGEVAIYRFISYRINEDIVSLAAVMIDKEAESVTWLVGGPDRLLQNTETRPVGSETGQGVWLAQFADAAEQFTKLLDAIAPKK